MYGISLAAHQDLVLYEEDGMVGTRPTRHPALQGPTTQAPAKSISFISAKLNGKMMGKSVIYVGTGTGTVPSHRAKSA